MLTVSDLSIARGGIRVLEGVNFTLSAGNVLVLRGPNGIGKTTLLRTVAGLQPPVSGQIDRDPEALIYTGHADGVKAMLSVVENLQFWASIFGGGACDAAMAAFDLTGLADRPAGMLSAGQKRRLGLARLLVTGRPLWILDEPTVSLDAASVEMFAAAVRTHLGQGGAALMATHIELGLPEAERLDLTAFRATRSLAEDFDEAFL